MSVEDEIKAKEREVIGLQMEIKELYLKKSCLDIGAWYKDKHAKTFFKPLKTEDDGTVWGIGLRCDSSDGVYLDMEDYYSPKIIQELELEQITHREFKTKMFDFMNKMLDSIK